MKCDCGSNIEADDVYDIMGNFISIVCKLCRKEKLSVYHEDLFQDHDFGSDEDEE